MKKLIYFMLIVLAYLLPCKGVFAAESKVMIVPLLKNYSEIIFYFDFSDGQDHEIYITTPSGEVINNVSTTETASVSVEKAIKGEYIIEIIADQEIDVKARVECKNNTTSAGSNVTISSALSNLRVYFLNGDLAVQWEDTGAGDVNIKVTNPQTMQVIADVKTSESSCLIPLDDAVKKIEVYVVPTSSAKLNGAGIGYTLDVVRDIGVEATFPAYSITNQTSVSVMITNSQKVKVYSVTNKIEAEAEVYEPGTHEYMIPLTSNDNTVFLYAEDVNGNIVYETFTMKQDMIAPSISFNNQYDGYSTKESSIVLDGYARDAKELYINNAEIEIDQYERFSCEYPLEKGENVISICASDEAGNQAVITLTVTRQENRSILIPLIAGILIIAFIVAVLVMLFKKKSIGSGNKNDSLTEKQKKKGRETKPPKQAQNLQKSPFKRTIVSGERSKKMRERKFITEVIISCIQLGALAFFLTFCVRNTIVASGSMEPTLMTHDIVIYNKLSYLFKPIERGDIVNFWSEEYGAYFAKRVIGIAGDVIEFHDGYTFINGQKCDESAYIADSIETNCIKTFVVPEGTVFVMGDNRENSIDSRFFKNPYIPVDDIEGKYLGTIPWLFD